MPKKTTKRAGKKSLGSSRGRGRRVATPSPPPSPQPPSDIDDAASVASQASSVASVGSIASHGKKKRAKKTQFCLDVQEEQAMCDFLRENTILWDIKKTDYRRVDKKSKVWEDQAMAMGKTVEHLQGWFKSLRDTYTRLDKKKSGDGAPELTEREQWVKANFSFLKTVVRHHAEPVKSVSRNKYYYKVYCDYTTLPCICTFTMLLLQVKAAIAANNGNLEAAEAAYADIVVDEDSTPSPVHATSSQCKGKRRQGSDQLLESLQKRVQESGELLKVLQEPQPVTPTITFANYVRDSLVSMSKRKFRKARSKINTFLSELMEEASDEEEAPVVPMFSAPGPSPMRPRSAPAAPISYAPTLWGHTAPGWGSAVDQYMHQPLQPLQLQPPPQGTVSAALGSASQVLNASPSGLDTSQNLSNISGLSGFSSLEAAGSPSASGNLNTPPPPEKN